jgi:nucleoside-diphosphate-sugar epimerase
MHIYCINGAQKGSKMSKKELQVVTGAFGFLGKYITRLLIERGIRVKTLTNHPDRPNPFGRKVEAVPFHFDDPAAMADELKGATTVFNTYWYPGGGRGRGKAVRAYKHYKPG